MIRRFCLALLAVFALPLAAMAQAGPPQGRYIVVLNDGLGMPEDVAADVAQRTGGHVGYVYENALRGFSITMPRAAVLGIMRDRRVAYVEDDIPVGVFAGTLPTGVDRIFRPGTTDPVASSGSAIDTSLSINGVDDKRVDVDVAVLDTGIDVQHPDLNVVGGANCLQTAGNGPPWARGYVCDPNSSFDDDHYHGTHVAGTIGALDNDFGVVGVAPGARLWAVKVLDSNGSGYLAGIIAGIDWVRGQGNIEVINMSLGGSGQSDAMDTAIKNAVDSGVTVVVAAGNSAAEAANYTPANAPDAFTVSALADFDGKSGGVGSPTCRTDQDDTLADFSNWSKLGVVNITAPGVCILSTYPIERGSYGTISGTSMASPHVAGAAALLASGPNPPTGRTDVNKIRSDLLKGNFDWTDDSGDGVKEPLLDISTFTPVFVGDTTGGGGGGGGDSGTFTLSATGYKVKGLQKADLSWSGAASAKVDVYRDGAKIIPGTNNDGVETDNINQKGGGSYTYKVCEAGSTTTCSNEWTVTF